MDKLEMLKAFLAKLGKERTIPTIIKKHDYGEHSYEEYVYPVEVLENILSFHEMRLIRFSTKKEKIDAIKLMLDLYKSLSRFSTVYNDEFVTDQ